jgi:pyridoxine 5-phosphate synthase
MRVRRRLGVNIDHVATVRQARQGAAPDPVTAAGIAELSGADGITVHLREDRRHIQDRDLSLLKRVVQTRINLEMGATEEMLGIATDLMPYSVTLVPERRQEITTEGGLDVLGQEEALRGVVSRLRGAGILVSLFIAPDLAQVRAAKEIGADAFEIHTGPYCEAFREGRHAIPFERIRIAASYGAARGLKVFAGHGLDTRNIIPLLSLSEIEEFNIGHSIVARAVFIGFSRAVRELADIIHGG